MRICIGLLTLHVVLLSFGVLGTAKANNTITGVVKDCLGNPVPGSSALGIAVTAVARSPGQSCPAIASNYCSFTSNGTYSLSVPSNASDTKWCISAVPDGHQAGCAACPTGKCCNGSQVAVTNTSVTIPANTDNQTYTANIDLTYSGSCNTGTGVVSDLASVDCTASSLQLYWTAPCDSGCTVLNYDVRYSTSSINDSNWSSASQATGEPAPLTPGESQTFWVTGLSGCTIYYFAMKAQVRTSAYSGLSNVPAGKTKCGSQPCETEGPGR